MADQERYARRGVSADKLEVHRAIQHLDEGLFPMAFCKVLPDIVGGEADFCNIMHADTAGTKTSLAYLYWRETGDLNVWKGVIQDAIVMNIDDMGCVGCIDDILLSSTIGRNKNLIPGEVLEALIRGTSEFIEQMADCGLNIHLTGGETADVGDIVRTVDVGFTTFGRLRRSDLVINDIRPGQVIVGCSSFGQSKYESEYNGGMGSNGLTSARHDLFHSEYGKKYPESCDPNLPEEVKYVGPYHLQDPVELPNGKSTTIGKLVLSPTRTYLPIIAPMLEHYRSSIHGMIHCSGGAQTKVLKFMPEARVVKDQLFSPPTLFQLIREATNTPYREMYKVFNMGHRFELYVDPEAAEGLIQIAANQGVEAKIIGRVEESNQREVHILSPDGERLKYS
jgi:phosphoribosylformylglycinamidine cyclo-ligase